jgi:hypothetical protein
MSRNKDDLNFATRFRYEVVEVAMTQFGYPIFIVRTYDSLARQLKLYAIGRTVELDREPVTKIKRGWHNIRENGEPYSRAIDVAFKHQKRFPDRKSWDENWPWARLRKIAYACDLDIPIKWDKGHIIDRQGETFKQAWAKSDQN